MRIYPRQLRLLILFTIALIAAAMPAQQWDGRDILVVKREPEKHARTAVIVSVDRYADAGKFPPLRFADKDADDLAGLLANQGFGVKRMRLGGDGNVVPPLSAEAVYGEVASMCKKADPPDTILFFFSGHGFSNKEQVSFLCPHHCDIDDLENSAVSIERIAKMMKQSSARKAVLIADACRNIPGEKSVSAERRIREFELAQGLGIMFSTEPGSRSYEPVGEMKDQKGRKIENGVFSHFLLHALRGEADGVYRNTKDGYVTFREVGYWVGRQLKQCSAINQKSWIKWEGGSDDDIWMTKAKSGAVVEAVRNEVAELPGKSKVKIRLYTSAGSSGGRKKVEATRDRMKLEGFDAVEVISLNKRGMSKEEQRRRFIVDTRLSDWNMRKQRHVYYAPKLAPYVEELRKIFGKRHEFIERPEDCRQRGAEGASVDLIIDWLGAPSQPGR